MRAKKEITMECMLSDPRPHVKWFKNGEPIEVGLINMTLEIPQIYIFILFSIYPTITADIIKIEYYRYKKVK